MRYIYQATFRDGSGNIVNDGTVHIYLSGTDTPASVYEASSGGTSVDHVETDEYGYFCFYVDTSDYGVTQQFKLKLHKDGYTTKYYDNLNVFPFAKNINYGANEIDDGDTIAHGLGETPTWVIANTSVAKEFVSITAVGSTTFTCAIKKDDGSAGTKQTIYWQAGV